MKKKQGTSWHRYVWAVHQQHGRCADKNSIPYLCHNIINSPNKNLALLNIKHPDGDVRGVCLLKLQGYIPIKST